MPRPTVKLLLVDQDERLLLLRSEDPATSAVCWYPVGGGVEPGESLHAAARREAYEETGLATLPDGEHVWTRDHTYRYDARTVEVHEDWLLVRVPSFAPAPARLTEREARTLTGARWWRADELAATTETVFPPGLGARLATLLREGAPTAPVDISDPSAP